MEVAQEQGKNGSRVCAAVSASARDVGRVGCYPNPTPCVSLATWDAWPKCSLGEN